MKNSALGGGAIWSMLDNLAQQALSFLVFLVLARLVAPQDFGLIAIAHVLVTFVRNTLFDAISHPVARTAVPDDFLYSRALTACVLLAIAIAGVMAAGAVPIAGLYGQPMLVPVLMWMSLVVLATGCSAIFEARLIRQMQFKPLAIRSIVSVCIGGGVGLALAFKGHGVMALVGQQVVTSCTALALLVAQSHWLPHFVWRGLDLKGFLPEGSKVGSTGFFNFMTSQGDTLLVSVLMGSYATGIYNFAKRLTSAVYLVIGSALLKLAISAFADAHGQSEKLRKAYLRILGICLFLMAPLLVGMAGVAEPLVTHMFGDIWKPAAPVIALLAAFYLLLAINQLNDYVMFAVGERTLPTRRGMVQIALVLALGWAFARFGLTWTSAAFVAGALLVWPWVQRVVNRYLQISFVSLAQSLATTMVATACMVASLWLVRWLPLTGVWALSTMVLTGAIAYLASYRLSAHLLPGSHNAMQDLLSLRKRA